jgi:SAM-dependent methyltransferase
MQKPNLMQKFYHLVFPKSLRMRIYWCRHPEFRLAEKLSKVSRDGIEQFLDWLAGQQLFTGNVLEVGSGGRTQNRTRFSARATNYWRSDVRLWPNAHLELICDCTRCPFPDHSLDAVICSEVLEHVPDSMVALNEFGRILKPEGWLAITVPFFYPIHGVDAGDRGDYWRFTPGNLRGLLQHDFELMSENRTHLFSQQDSFIVNVQTLWKRRRP